MHYNLFCKQIEKLINIYQQMDLMNCVCTFQKFYKKYLKWLTQVDWPVNLTYTFFWFKKISICSLLRTRKFGMLCFSIMLTIWKWCWNHASFLAPSETSTFPVVATRLRYPSLWRKLRPNIGVALMFLREKSSLLLSKTFAVVYAIP